MKVCAHFQHDRPVTKLAHTIPATTITVAHECAIGERLATDPITGRQAYLRVRCSDKNRLGDCTDYLERLDRPWDRSLKSWIRRTFLRWS